jgi:hypothetical protein
MCHAIAHAFHLVTLLRMVDGSVLGSGFARVGLSRLIRLSTLANVSRGRLDPHQGNCAACRLPAKLPTTGNEARRPKAAVAAGSTSPQLIRGVTILRGIAGFRRSAQRHGTYRGL